MKPVVFGDLTISWPESYDDLCFEDRAEITKLTTGLLAFTGQDTVLIWRSVLRVICRRSFTSAGKFRRWWAGLQLSFEQWEELKSFTAWAGLKPETRPFEAFEHGGVRYLVVADRFSGVSAAEWVEGIMDFMALGTEQEGSETMDILISNFCRPARENLFSYRASDKWNGDAREVYNRQKALERAVDLADLDVGIKIQVVWWLEVLMQNFFGEFEHLFSGGGTEEPPRYPDGRGYLMLLKNVAKQGFLGDFDRVANTDVTTVFALLLDEVYDSEKVKNNN